MRSASALLLALLLGACCARAARAPVQTSASSHAAPVASSPTQMGPTGLVDEETFKRLHELRADAAPAPLGTTIDLAGGHAYLSLPEGRSAPLPGLVVIHEWWGLNDHIRHWSDRLAADGYAALAVDLYDGRVATDRDEAMALVKGVDTERARTVLAAAHRFLREDARTRSTRSGVIGWCFGGGWALQDAIAEPDLQAAVIYYGRLVTEEEQLRRIAAPLLGVFANRDPSIPPSAVDEFAAALGRAGKSIELHRYDADHAFANPSGAHYDQPAATDAWQYVRAFLRRTLQQGPPQGSPPAS